MNPNNQTPQQPIPQPQLNAQPASDATFKFLSYYFDRRTLTANFVYQGIDNIIFSEKVSFATMEHRHFNITDDPSLNQLLDRALFLAFILIGTSYYKAHPTTEVKLDLPLDEWQAGFFNKVYQEGLSQFAFQNGLTRDHLAHFHAKPGYQAPPTILFKGGGILGLQSGGKDSLLTAALLEEKQTRFYPWYVSSAADRSHPAVIDHLVTHQAALVAHRQIDLTHLEQTGGLNGHVPVTYILKSLAVIQAILTGQNTILTSIGQEGNEPHAMVGDLPVNHQWSKTWEAELLFAEYVHRYLTEGIQIGSTLRSLSELKIAELFIRKCWIQYGFSFSSCNTANYKQGNDTTTLRWCGECAKCLNTYILFSPFLAPPALQALFGDRDLYLITKDTKPEILQTFRGLLGVDNVMKPFECVGTIEELRAAYQMRQPGFAALPLAVPPSNFDYNARYEMQNFIKELNLNFD